jgi:hypothetical protein
MDKPNLRLDIKKSAEEGNSTCGRNKRCIQAEKMIPNVIAKRCREVLFFLPGGKSILTSTCGIAPAPGTEKRRGKAPAAGCHGIWK